MWKVNDFCDRVVLVSLQERKEDVINYIFPSVCMLFHVLISATAPSLTSVDHPTNPSIKGSLARFSSL